MAQLPMNSGSDHGLARRLRLQSITRGGDDVLKRPHWTINCQKSGSNMPCSLWDPVILWESIGGGSLLYGVQHDKLQKLLKEKRSRASLQRLNPFSWL